MPSLQQTSFKDWPSPDIARSLTGPDILQKHSINSLLLEHNEIISRGLPSPIEENVSFSDILGSSQSSQSTSTSSLLGTNGNSNNNNSSSNNGSNLTHSVSINCNGKGSAGHNNHHHHLQHQPTLASFSSLSSLGGGGPDSASSILSSSLSGGTTTGSSPSVGGNPFNFGGLSMSSSSLNSPELGNGGGGGGSSSTGGGGGQSPTYYGNGLHSTSTSAKNYEDFRFDNDISLSGSTATGGVGANSLTSEALKLLQRNMASSYDCSLPTSPNAVSSSSSSSAAAAAAGLCARYFRGAQQLNDLSHNNNNHGSSSNSNNNGNGYHESSLFGGHHQSLSRSNSPPDNDSSLLANFDSTNILDMISYLTISQQQQQQHQQNNQHYGSNSSSSTNGGSSHSPYGGANLNQFYQQQQQHQQNSCGGGSMSSFGGNNGNCNSNNNSQSSNCGGTGFTSSDYERLQNLQALNALRLLQQQSQQLSQFQQYQQFNQLVPNYGGNSQLKNWPLQNSPPSSSGSSSGNDINLDRIARFHRSSAAHYDATCTWSGVLPPRSHRLVTYSSKIFLGGMPWDISEQSLVQIFKPFGSIKVEWPGKEQQATQPKGYVYIIFESDKQVKALLQACTYTYTDGSSYNGSSRGGGGGNSPLSVNNAITGGGGGDDQQLQLVQQQSGQQQLMLPNKLLPTSGARINFKISSKRIKSKDVEVIPWNIADSNYVKSTSQKLDPTKTVFVGALHGQLTAEGLAQIMNDLFDGVVYVGIDTDKYKYPLGSARVTFNNSRSYMKAVVAAFIEIKTAKFTKKLQVDPYLEDSLCSMCSVQHGPYFCREIVCFRYFCRSCWQFQHNRDTSLQNHKPLTRNSKSTTIIGVGPQQQQGGGGGGGSQHQQQQNHHSYSSQLNYHHHQNHQQQQMHHHSHYHGGSLHGSPKSPSPSCTTTSTSSSADSSPVSCHGPANLHQQLQQQFGSL